jgi:hypothetical protein
LKSSLTPEYWDCFRRLPAQIQERARQKYRLWRDDPFHPSLQFKEVRLGGLWSVRVSSDYRALGWREGDAIGWFWIGSHAEYDTILTMM